MKTYEIALTMYVSKDLEDAVCIKDSALEKLKYLEQVAECDWDEDDEDYNIFTILQLQARTLNVQTISNKLMKLLPNLPWDYHYIKGIDNNEYWQP